MVKYSFDLMNHQIDKIIILVQNFIYEHIAVIGRNFLTQLLFEGQSNGVRFSSCVCGAALQIIVIEPLPSSKTPS